MKEALRGATPTPHELRLLTKIGDFLVAEIISTPKIENGRIVEVSAIARDITDRKRMEETLRHQALHDALTGLPNRTLLRDRVHQATLAARRDRRPLALLVMDLDQFKEVNDTLGHEAGDILLQQMSARLQNAIRASDTVARLGGDEFAVLLPIVHRAGATRVALKLLEAIEPPIPLAEHGVEIRLSIGIALYPDHGEDAEALLRRADVAMYAAKHRGSGFQVYEPNQDQYSPQRLALRAELRAAIERDELTLHYQPKVDLATARIAGVEALIRWQHPRHGLVPPGQFIPWAEEVGLIHPISHWVLQAAIKQAGAWHAAGLDLPIAVNLSAADLHDDALSQTIGDLLESLNVPPADLVLEITESKIMTDPGRALGTLARLHTMGVPIALDDFGTGYSSLGYLKRLPVTQVKIDKSFVIDMATDQNDAAIVLATISLSHALGLTVVAEGVEETATWEALASLGCDQVQGYYVARPMAAADFLEWLQASPWGVGVVAA
jgi:diguanylate cyclase (GGDEF)-like protein